MQLQEVEKLIRNGEFETVWLTQDQMAKLF